MRDIDKTSASNDAIEACIANMMGKHGRVKGLQLATEEHGLRAVRVWERMQLIHTTGYAASPYSACGDAIGTVAGYTRHRRKKERPCEDCRTAMNFANGVSRMRQRPRQRGVATVDQVRVDRWCNGESQLGLNQREKREVIRRRLRDDWTAGQIAAELGLTLQSVQRAIRGYGLRDGRLDRETA